LPVGAVDLDDAHVLSVEVPGEPGTVAASALDTDQLDVSKGPQPAEEAAVARRRGLEGLHAQQGTAVIQRGGDVHVEVGVDTSGDPEWHRGHRSSLR
jgi:hypothetical protein